MNKSTYIISVLAASAAIVATLFFAHTVNAPQSLQTTAPTSTAAIVSSTTPERAPHSLPRTVQSDAVTPASTTTKTEMPTQTVAEPVNSYVVPVTARESVLDAMHAYASSSAFTFTGRNYPSLGFFVDSIGGKQNANGLYWILYVNGTSSSLGASSAVVSPGDTVEWRYEKSD